MVISTSNPLKKYRFAKNLHGNVVDARDVSDEYVKESHNSFTCLECGEAMNSRRGPKRVAYFAHKPGNGANCSYESYLHKTGISQFIKAYKKRMAGNATFSLEVATGLVCFQGECVYGRDKPCRNVTGYEIVELLPKFNKIEREVYDGDFVPDVLLTADDGSKVYIEIVVSHFCEPCKRNAGIPIVEIELKSEEDYDLFQDGFVSGRSPKVQMFNFDQYMVKKDFGCEESLLSAKKEFLQNFNNHYIGCNSWMLNYEVNHVCDCGECPYFVGHPCCSKSVKNISLALEYAIVPETPYTEPLPNVYLKFRGRDETIQVSFVYRLSPKSDLLGGMKTIQFAVDNKKRRKPWMSDVIEEDDDSTRFFNFPTIQPIPRCKISQVKFALVVLKKGYRVEYPGNFDICTIQYALRELKDNYSDYILIPNPDKLPDHIFSIPVLERIVTEDLASTCADCTHAKSKRNTDALPDEVNCGKLNQICTNTHAQVCNFFERRIKHKNRISAKMLHRECEPVFDAWNRYRLKL